MVLTSGLAISFHYCMNRLDSTTIFAATDDTCGRCGMHVDEAKGCCREEVKLVKLDDDHQLSALVDFSISQPVVEAPVSFAENASLIASNKAWMPAAVRPPPPDSGPQIYLANRVFRI